MRNRVAPIALAALLAAPAGFVLAQPADVPPRPDQTAPAFTPGDWRPAPEISSEPGEQPAAGAEALIAPQGWVPDEDIEAGIGTAPETDDQAPGEAQAGGQDHLPEFRRADTVPPTGWPTEDDAEDGAAAAQPDGDPSDETSPDDRPDALPDGGIAAPMGPDGRHPIEIAPDRPDAEPDAEVALPMEPGQLPDTEVEIPPGRQAEAATGLRELRDYVAIRTRPLFAPDRSPPRAPEPDPLPVVAAEPDPLPDPPAIVEEEAFIETAPEWELVGLVRSERLNSAMFRKFGEADGFSLRRGESRDGWMLAEIGRFEVVLENEHGQARLTFQEN